jgi:hypothetical protein
VAPLSKHLAPNDKTLISLSAICTTLAEMVQRWAMRGLAFQFITWGRGRSV